MNALILVLSITSALARPDIGIGYNYRPPVTRLNPPLPTNFGFSQNQFSGGSSVSSGLTGGFNGGGSALNLNSIGSSGGLIQQNSGLITEDVRQNVFKHVYVYSAPQEQRGQGFFDVETAPRRKNYKIIFIKAPSYQSTAAQLIQQQQQTAEKTIVYVLVKKPEDYVQSISQASAQSHSKPEVYFIKYKAKQEIAPTFVESSQNGQISGVAHDGHKEVHQISNDFDHSVSTGSSGQVHTSYGVPVVKGPY